MDSEPISASTRRVVIRALFLVVPVIGLSLAAPRVLPMLRGQAGPTAPAPVDRPPTDAELRESASADRRLAALEQDALSRSTVIAPDDARVDEHGARVRRFEGFGVSVESTPPGAWVRANGADVGTTPLVASLACAPGAEVILEVGGPRLKTARRTVRCREDTLVEIAVQLAR